MQFLKEELASSTSTLTSICKRYSESPNKWQALYSDVRRWAKEDPELEELLKEHRLRTDSKSRKTVAGGRPKKDKEETLADWRVNYCNEILKSKSRVKAASVTPYTYEEIYQMLNDKYSSYDKDFAEMVHLTEMKLIGWAEEEIWLALNDATSPKDRAWIAKEILKVRDRQRWGDKLDVNVQSTHTHKMEIDRGKLLLELEADRRGFFDSVKSKQLEADNEIVVEVIHD